MKTLSTSWRQSSLQALKSGRAGDMSDGKSSIGPSQTSFAQAPFSLCVQNEEGETSHEEAEHQLAPEHLTSTHFRHKAKGLRAGQQIKSRQPLSSNQSGSVCVQDDEAESSADETDHKPAPEHLTGARIKHKAEDMGEGETVIMTLADRAILDERGELDDDNDELENVLAVCP